MITPKEKEILLLLNKDDPSAIRMLFDQFHPSLCLTAYHVLKDKDQAKDVVQDVFLKLWNGRKELAITTSIRAYLKRATINTALNALERSNRYKGISLEQSGEFHPSSNTTENEQAFDDLQAKADHAIDQLPVRTRTVFVLIRLEEMSYVEVSQALNISTKAVEKEMMKALRLLREALKDYLNLSIVLMALSLLG